MDQITIPGILPLRRFGTCERPADKFQLQQTHNPDPKLVTRLFELRSDTDVPDNRRFIASHAAVGYSGRRKFRLLENVR